MGFDVRRLQRNRQFPIIWMLKNAKTLTLLDKLSLFPYFFKYSIRKLKWEQSVTGLCYLGASLKHNEAFKDVFIFVLHHRLGPSLPTMVVGTLWRLLQRPVCSLYKGRRKQVTIFPQQRVITPFPGTVRWNPNHAPPTHKTIWQLNKNMLVTSWH